MEVQKRRLDRVTNNVFSEMGQFRVKKQKDFKRILRKYIKLQTEYAQKVCETVVMNGYLDTECVCVCVCVFRMWTCEWYDRC